MACSCYGLSATVRFLGRNFGVYAVSVHRGPASYVNEARRSSYIDCITREFYTMSTRLYVGGIPYRSTEEDLKVAFSQAGTVVSTKIIIDRATGRSRGFGFVEMSTPEEAAKAIELWHGKELDGRTLTVNEERPLENRDQA